MEDFEEIEFDNDDEEILEDKYLTVEVAGKRFAVNIEYVREIVTLPEVREVPASKPNERGIIKVRGELIHVIDIRTSLGLQSIEEEDKLMIDQILKRKNEHVQWLNDLFSSVNDRKEFKGQTDPNQCAFGVWYNNFQTDDINLSLYLSYFDTPHKKLHNIAKKIKQLQHAERHDDAIDLIEKTRNNEFKELIKLFDGINEPIKESHREVVVIIEKDGDLQGISVDAVDKIINIPAASIDKKGELKKNEYVKGVSDIEGSPVVILDYNRIIG